MILTAVTCRVRYTIYCTSKDLQNIPFQKLKGPLKHFVVCLVLCLSAAFPVASAPLHITASWGDTKVRTAHGLF